MRTTPSYLNRWMTTAVLLGALGLPLTACAQTSEAAEKPVEAVEEVQDAATESVQADDAASQATESAGSSTEASGDEMTAEEAEAKAIKEELEQLQTQARIRQARLQAELAPLQEEKSRLEAELALANARQQAHQAEQQRQIQQQAFEQQVAMAQMQREMERVQAELKLAQLKAQLDAAKQAASLSDLAAQSATITAELTTLQAQRGYDSIDRDEMQYPAQPLKDGVLTISDRRIPLNGPIGGGTADYVTERIHYFNNLSPEAPIFIVIDGSPGGSVMEGYRIVTAMENSDAPVHVVVKSYAASMAAVITTLAEESYCYPNAIILHHQMSSSMRGNLTQQGEQLEEGFEWAKRLADPVAEKMGVDYDEFVELMYENNSDGDWAEFGDVSKELKWVNHVVSNIRETAVITAPGGRGSGTVYMQGQDNPEPGSALPQPLSQWDLFNSPIAFETKQDGNGNAYIELPKLSPYDYYFMHDPYGQYRMAK
ncbi:MAG: ATP-dependent Clp protease proteolytic subunit [Planctomycetota bacterium]